MEKVCLLWPRKFLKDALGKGVLVNQFRIVTEFEPKGDQIKAISKLVDDIEKGALHQVLLGVTGSGKTFTIANVIHAVQRPALVIVHNKTLAAQLYGEFKTAVS